MPKTLQYKLRCFLFAGVKTGGKKKQMCLYIIKNSLLDIALFEIYEYDIRVFARALNGGLKRYK